MNKRVKAVIEQFEAALGTDVDLDHWKETVKSFVKGTAAEQKAAAAIAGNVASTIGLLQLGQATPAHVTFAVEQAKLGAISLAETKVIRLQVAAVRVFFDAITLGLSRLLAA